MTIADLGGSEAAEGTSVSRSERPRLRLVEEEVAEGGDARRVPELGGIDEVGRKTRRLGLRQDADELVRVLLHQVVRQRRDAGPIADRAPDRRHVVDEKDRLPRAA